MTVSLYSPEYCEKLAQSASLIYVRDDKPGITRERRGKHFVYYAPNGQKIDDSKQLQRIKALAIPPAYQQVWICPSPRGHIQATARDTKNRKQYRYHALWREVRAQTKFNTMLAFGRALPQIRAHIQQELDKSLVLTKEQIVCAIIYLLDNYHIRIGNTIYAKENKSYGLTTLRKKHLSIEQNKAILDFAGKNSKPWHVVLKDKKMIRLLKKCEEIPGYELFKYQDEQGEINVISSQDINSYLQALTSFPFTAKDFRTWAACREVLYRLITFDFSKEYCAVKDFKTIVEEVAGLLGHTPAICQKNYIHSEIIVWWQEQKFSAWIKKKNKKLSQLNKDELLLYWLEAQKTSPLSEMVPTL